MDFLTNSACALDPAHTGTSVSVGTCLALWCALSTVTESQIDVFAGTYMAGFSG